MPKEYAERLARHLIALEDLSPEFEVDVLDHVETDELIEALRSQGCTVERVPGKTRLNVTHPRAAQKRASEAKDGSGGESSDSQPSEFRLFLRGALGHA